jgi:hypothetical protein
MVCSSNQSQARSSIEKYKNGWPKRADLSGRDKLLNHLCVVERR